MSSPNFRALCAEIVQAAQVTTGDNDGHDVLERLAPILDKARAALVRELLP
jgi:hypothetical protein